MDLIGPLELQSLRDLAGSAMPDTCTITRTTGRGAYNLATNTHDDPSEDDVWEGPCWVARGGLGAVDAVTGDLAEVLGRYTVHLPHDASAVKVGDVITVDTSTDPQLVGQFLTVSAVPVASLHAERVVEVEDPQMRSGS